MATEAESERLEQVNSEVERGLRPAPYLGVVMSAGWQSLFVAGLLIGISIGLFTSHFAVWAAIGAVLGIVMAAGRRSQRRNLSAKQSVETATQD